MYEMSELLCVCVYNSVLTIYMLFTLLCVTLRIYLFFLNYLLIVNNM